MLEHSDKIYVKRVPGKGRGVFARQAIAAGEVIEKVPKMLVPVNVIVDGLKNSFLPRFFFLHNDEQLAVCLGYGSLYNHSYLPNAEYIEGPASTMIFRAIRDIERHQEICINYNGDPADQTPVGFKVVE